MRILRKFDSTHIAYLISVIAMAIYAVNFRFADLVVHAGGNAVTTGVIVSLAAMGGLLSRICVGITFGGSKWRNVYWVSCLIIVLGSIGQIVFSNHLIVLAFSRVLVISGIMALSSFSFSFAQKVTRKRERSKATVIVGGCIFLGMMIGSTLPALLDSLPLPFHGLKLNYFCGAVFSVTLLPIGIFLPKREVTITSKVKTSVIELRKLFQQPECGVAIVFGSISAFMSVFFIRYLSENDFNGFETFFCIYCIVGMAVSLGTRDWVNLVGPYRLILLGLWANCLFLVMLSLVDSSWNIWFLALIYGVGRAFLFPSLVSVSQRLSHGNISPIRGAAILSAIDVGTLVAAPLQGTIIEYSGYIPAICFEIVLVISAVIFFIVKSKATSDQTYYKRRKADWNVPRSLASDLPAELIGVYTDDQVYLQGYLRHPIAIPLDSDAKADIVLFIHGNGDDCFRPSVFDSLSKYFLSAGIGVLRINTRGKGTVTNFPTRSGNVRIGSAFEKLSDCVLDINAWIKTLKGRGYSSIGLVGHSLGAVKGAYFLRDQRFAASFFLALSPPRLSYSNLCKGIGKDELSKTIKLATELVNKNKGKQILRVSYPMSYLTSAESFLDKYGLDEDYCFLELVKGVKVPTLITVGELEHMSSDLFRNIHLDVNALEIENVTARLIKDGNHFYKGVRETLLEEFHDWFSMKNAVAYETQGEGIGDISA